MTTALSKPRILLYNPIEKASDSALCCFATRWCQRISEHSLTLVSVDSPTADKA